MYLRQGAVVDVTVSRDSTAEARASDTFSGMLCGVRSLFICRYDNLKKP